MPSTIKRGLALSLVAAVLLVARPAAAELVCAGDAPRVADEAALAEARAQFVRGTQLADANRWTEALTAFERSYALSRLPAALFNAARALEELGRFRAAAAAYECAFETDLSEDQRSIRDRYDETRARLSRLVVEGLPAREVEVEVDGLPIDDDARPLELVLDPGDHVLVATRPQLPPFRWEGTLAAGELRTLDVDFETLTPARVARATTPEPDAPASTPVLESPIFWASTGLVAIGIVVTVVVLSSRSSPDPMSDIVYEL